MMRTIGDGRGGRKHVEHAMDTYSPNYELPPLGPSLPLNPKQVTKETYMRLKDFQKVQMLAYQEAPEEARAKLHREKKEMHQKSGQAVKNWSNTVLGQRKKRLLAIEEKAQRQEAERQRLDKEWADIQQYERQQAIERARKLQKYESQKYKTLHSQLLLSSVLLERDMQVERKQKKRELEKASSQSLSVRDPFTKSVQEENEALEQGKQMRLEIAKYQKEQMDKKEATEYNLQKAEFDYYVNENKKLSEELKAKKEADAKKARDFKTNWRTALESVISLKKDVSKDEKEYNAQLDSDNDLYLRRKTFIAQKHKEFVNNRFKSRDDIYEKIATLALSSEKEKEDKIVEFIEKGVESHVNDYDERTAREKDYKEKLVADTLKVRQIQVDAKKEKIEQEKKEIKAFKQQIDEQFALHVAQSKDKVVKRIQTNLLFRDLQGKQIEEHRRKQELARQAARFDHSNTHQVDAQEDFEFDKYAQQVLQEWKSCGRDTRLMTRTIEKLKPKEHALPRAALDTFDRLGFTLRDLKEPELVTANTKKFKI